MTALKEATDEAVRRDVPQGADYDPMLGHLAIGLAILFGALPSGQFSDGAELAIAEAESRLPKDGWLGVMSPNSGMESVQVICNPKAA